MSKIWPSTTIIILTWNGVDYTRNCLESIKAYTRLNGQTQVMVVDNGSTDGTLPYLRQLDWITLVENGRNLGFVKGNNVGIQTAPPGNDILLLNNDTLIRQDKWLDEIQRVAYSADDVGIVGCRMVLGDGRLLHAGAYMPQDSFWGSKLAAWKKMSINMRWTVR